MHSITAFERSSAFQPSFVASSYMANEEYSSIKDIDFYASSLIRRLSSDFENSNFHQPEIHVTFGQVFLSPSTELGPRLGLPSLYAVWAPAGALPKWVSSVLQLCSDAREDSALKEISLVTARVKEQNEFVQFSADLKRIDLERLPDIILVALLRNTFSIRSNVQGWASLLDKIERLLLKRNQQPRLLLRGLKKFL